MSTPRQPPHYRHARDDDGGARTGRLLAEPAGGEPATAILLAAAHALTGWDGFERSSERFLGELAGALGLAAGALWLRAGETLLASTVWCMSEQARVELEGALRLLRLGPGDSLPGSAWERREPIHRALTGAERSGDARHGRYGDLHAHLAVPVCAGDEVLGVVEMYATAHAELSGRLLDVLGIAGHVCWERPLRAAGES
jgi:hypothetical protein